MTDEENVYKAEHLFDGLDLRGDDEFLAVTCKSCNRPFSSQMDKTFVQLFTNIILEGQLRIGYVCPYSDCDGNHEYDVLEHYWGAIGPPIKRPGDREFGN